MTVFAYAPWIAALSLQGPPAPLPSAAATAKHEENTPSLTRNATGWGIGVSAGLTSGIGLSARRYFTRGQGLHLGGLYVFANDTHWGNLGLQGLFTLARTRKTRLYALAGAQLQLVHTDVYTAKGPEKTLRPTLFVGPGLGIEMHFTRHFGWAIELPASVVIALDGDKDRLPFGGRVNLIPALNTAFTFYFR